MTQDEAIQMVKDSNGKDSHLLPKVINGNLSLLGYTSLVSLPEGLTVNGDLFLEGCTSLESLPEGLTVNWSLYLFGCTSLRSIGNVTAKKIFLSKDHKIPDAEIAMARFSDIKVTLRPTSR